MKESMCACVRVCVCVCVVGRGGGPSKTMFTKKLKEIKDQNETVHKKLEGWCLWF